MTKADDLTIVIGPEGGITQDERNLLLDAGCLATGLGTTVLRVETAAVALVSAARAVFDHEFSC